MNNVLLFDKITREWISYWSKDEIRREKESSTWIISEMDKQVYESPFAAFQVILKIFDAIEGNPKLCSLLAAGDIDNLLTEHGMLVIHLFEAEASQNVGFRNMLKGVWLSELDPEVRERLQKCISEV